MSSAEATELMNVLNRVKTWPTTLRITLARKILESLDQAETPPAAPPTPMTRGLSAADAQRLLKTDRPPSDDKTVERSESIAIHAVSPSPRKRSLKDLLGILKTDVPPPNDEECLAILEEELVKKHLK